MTKYTIVGAGPCGLSIAYILSLYGHQITIIDREEEIGGCHRVKRVDNYFTEHGPRIYSSSYINMINLLDHMGIDFYSYFTKYNFSITTLGSQNVKNLKVKELLLFAYEFIKLYFSNSSKNITCMEFMKKNNFTNKSIDYIDRFVRLIDGGTANNYTLFGLLQLFNYTILHTLYQPTKPNDIGLFKDIKVKLTNMGVKFITGNVNKLFNNNNKIIGLQVNNTKIKVNNLILAIPPTKLVSLLERSSMNNAFGAYIVVKSWALRNSYKRHIPIVFHWNEQLVLPVVYGFPLSKWGITFIVLSDYMPFNESKTVISTCIGGVWFSYS